MIHYYTLDSNRCPVPCDVFAWSDMFNDSERRTIARDRGGPVGDEWELVTLFYGLDPYGEGPILFESGLNIDRRWRQVAQYDTWGEAEKGHEKLLASLRAGKRGGDWNV